MKESGDQGCVNAQVACGLLAVYEATGDKGTWIMQLVRWTG